MASAVVGVFEEYREAQNTVNELVAAGFDDADVRLNVSGLLGDEDSQAYDEATRHGHYVVTAIAADDDRTDLANEVMSHHHTIGLDESQSGVRVFYDVQEKPVAQTKSEQPRPVAGPEDLELGYRQHWERNYANDGGRYEAWVPAYRYGTSAAADGAYKGKEWSTVEPQLKVEWERQYPESKWERFKESVKHAFSRKD
jgi:hypothetical protein